MLSGKTFRLRAEILAISTLPDGKRLAVTIPAGEIFRVLRGPRPADRRMVDIIWKARTLVVFEEDIDRRWDEILN